MSDLSNKRFGKLVCIEKASRPRYWKCICDCGNSKEVRSNHLTMGKISTCAECPIFELPGKRFGNMQVLQYCPESGGKGIYRKFLCKCDCGNEFTSSTTRILNGNTVSCGRCIDKTSKIGKIVGYLRVVEWSHHGDHGNSYWKCHCICGTETAVLGCNLCENGVKSCGCKRIRDGLTRGENHCNHILTEKDVKKIRILWAKELVERSATGKYKSTYSIQDLADKYGVSYGTIYKVINSQTWFFLPPVNKYIKKINKITS